MRRNAREYYCYSAFPDREDKDLDPDLLDAVVVDNGCGYYIPTLPSAIVHINSIKQNISSDV